jgi:hypothetical protein
MESGISISSFVLHFFAISLAEMPGKKQLGLQLDLSGSHPSEFLPRRLPGAAQFNRGQ